MIAFYAGMALVASHVLGELLLRAGIWNGWPRTLGVGLLVTTGAYIATGAWTLWPVPIAATILFIAVRVVHHLLPEEMWAWVAIQLGALALVAAFVALGMPMLDVDATSVWARGVFVATAAATGLVSTVRLGGAFMNVAIRPFAVEMRGASIVESGGKVLEPLEGGFENGGRVIGYYERFLIFLFVLADAPTAIGFLVAAKSVLRFGELQDRRNRKNAEYIIIGTLMSFAFALVVAYGTRLLIGILSAG